MASGSILKAITGMGSDSVSLAMVIGTVIGIITGIIIGITDGTITAHPILMAIGVGMEDMGHAMSIVAACTAHLLMLLEAAGAMAAVMVAEATVVAEDAKHGSLDFFLPVISHSEYDTLLKLRVLAGY